jgi:hypothetical protein
MRYKWYKKLFSKNNIMSANTANSRARSRRGVSQQPVSNTPQMSQSVPEQNKPINVVDFIKVIDLRLKRIEDNLPVTFGSFNERLLAIETTINNPTVNQPINNTTIEASNNVESSLPSLDEILNEIATLQQQIRHVQTFSINSNNNFNRIVTKYKLLNKLEPDVNNTETINTEIINTETINEETKLES